MPQNLSFVFLFVFLHCLVFVLCVLQQTHTQTHNGNVSAWMSVSFPPAVVLTE